MGSIAEIAGESMGDDGPKQRANGFQAPLHPLQVVSWIVLGLDVLLYVSIALPLIDPLELRFIAAVCFTVSAVSLVVFAAIATRCDPADDQVRLKGKGHAEEAAESDEDAMACFCTDCSVPVAPRSKHCRVCNKCVGVFDHHCMWLNNCIGGRNYKAFLGTVSSASAMTGVFLGSCIYVLVGSFTDADAFEERMASFAHIAGLPWELLNTLLGVLAAINAPLFFLDSQLLVLHMVLMSQGLTTYEYIVNKRTQEATVESLGDDGGASAGASNSKHMIYMLPRSLDWIVFTRCGRKPNRKTNPEAKAASAAYVPDGDPDPSASDGAENAMSAFTGCGKAVLDRQPCHTQAPPWVDEKHSLQLASGTCMSAEDWRLDDENEESSCPRWVSTSDASLPQEREEVQVASTVKAEQSMGHIAEAVDKVQDVVSLEEAQDVVSVDAVTIECGHGDHDGHEADHRQQGHVHVLEEQIPRKRHRFQSHGNVTQKAAKRSKDALGDGISRQPLQHVHQDKPQIRPVGRCTVPLEPSKTCAITEREAFDVAQSQRKEPSITMRANGSRVDDEELSCFTLCSEGFLSVFSSEVQVGDGPSLEKAKADKAPQSRSIAVQVEVAACSDRQQSSAELDPDRHVAWVRSSTAVLLSTGAVDAATSDETRPKDDFVLDGSPAGRANGSFSFERRSIDGCQRNQKREPAKRRLRSAPGRFGDGPLVLCPSAAVGCRVV